MKEHNMKFKGMLVLIGGFIAFAVQEPLRTTPFKAEITPPTKQQEAFVILENKCNTCHRTKNPNKIFTLANMNELAPKIDRQVFLWKRMPKGSAMKLSSAEKLTLKNWIESVKSTK